MTANNTKNKSTAKRKLVPAVGMLLASAMALSSSTYAWFTMSREVSVTGIQMTASVPEDLQISAGLNMHTGTLTTANTNTNATKVSAPGDDDWSNTVRISDYYKFGYILPASSDTGNDIFFTPNANMAGKSVTVDATFTQADTTVGANMTSFGVGSTYASYTAEAGTKGYYIDIPVWFRTSSKTAQNLKVIATIGDGPTAGGDLYKAARVAILGTDSAAGDTQKNACQQWRNPYLLR
jgi:hypothetical protein